MLISCREALFDGVSRLFKQLPRSLDSSSLWDTSSLLASFAVAASWFGFGHSLITYMVDVFPYLYLFWLKCSQFWKSANIKRGRWLIWLK